MDSDKLPSDFCWMIFPGDIKIKHNDDVRTKNEFVLRFPLTFESPHYCKHNSLTHQHQVPYQGFEPVMRVRTARSSKNKHVNI